MNKRIINIALAVLIIAAASLGACAFSQFAGNYSSDGLKIIGELTQQPQMQNSASKGSPTPGATSEPTPSEPLASPGASGEEGQSAAPQTPSPTPQVIDENEVIGKVSLGDKAEATKLVLSRLSASDIATLRGYLKDGVTPEEKKQAIALIYSKFSPSEIEFIKSMYYKYMK